MNLGAFRRKLLVQYLATVGVLLLLGMAAIWYLVRDAGLRELEQVLDGEINKLAAAVQVDAKNPGVDGKKSLERARPTGQAVFWQVLADGRNIVRSRNLDHAVSLPDIGGEGLAQETLLVSDVEGDGGERMRVARLLTVRMRVAKEPKAKAKGKGKQAEAKADLGPREVLFDLRTAVSREDVDRQSVELAWLLAGTYPVFMVLAGLGGILLIRRAVSPVEAAFERERGFSGAVSHELRSPLTAMRGEIELALRRERTCSEHVSTLRRLAPIAERMNRTVEGLLVLARARGGQLLHGVGAVSVKDLQRSIQDMTVGCLRQGNVSVSCEAAGDARLRGDELLLSLAVRNLVENALEHGAARTVCVNLERDEQCLRVRVEDDGTGAPAEMFDAAGRLVETAMGSRGGEGTGLGLAITRAIVEAHGGTLTLVNKAAGGCQASLRVPLL